MTEKKIYILFTDTGTLFTKMIKLYTKQTYNHSSISFDSALSNVYSFGRKRPRNPFVGGFVREDMKQGLFKLADCAIYSITVTEDQIENMSRYILQIEEQQHQYCYNLLGLFGFICNRPIKRKKAFFCSQFVASVLVECNIHRFEKPLSLIAPSDLQSLSKSHLVFQGKLMDYNNKYDDNQVPTQLITVKM